MSSLLVRSGWYDRWGDMAEPKEEEVLSVEDESDDFYTKAYQAFKQGRDMPNRQRISDYALRETPAEIKNAVINLRPVQLEGTRLLC